MKNLYDDVNIRTRLRYVFITKLIFHFVTTTIRMGRGRTSRVRVDFYTLYQQFESISFIFRLDTFDQF